jgi:CheY-like chemotaxis protein
MTHHMNILLVDDDPISHLINRKVLQRIGLMTVDTANNGKDALMHVGTASHKGEQMPGAIFVDLNMPVMDGFGFIEAFNKLNLPKKESIRLAILTSSYNPSDRARAKELGVTHYLTKPATEYALRAVLESPQELVAVNQ